jgi:hypothetical protein
VWQRDSIPWVQIWDIVMRLFEVLWFGSCWFYVRFEIDLKGLFVPSIHQINLEVSLFTTLFILGLIFAGCIRFGDSLKS